MPNAPCPRQPPQHNNFKPLRLLNIPTSTPHDAHLKRLAKFVGVRAVNLCDTFVLVHNPRAQIISPTKGQLPLRILSHPTTSPAQK
jgi:hypothetical protein